MRQLVLLGIDRLGLFPLGLIRTKSDMESPTTISSTS